MRSILKLREQRSKCIHDAREILERAEKDGERALTSEEDENYKKAFGEARDLKVTIDREEAQLKEERDLEASVEPNLPKPGSGEGDEPGEEVRRRARPEYRAAIGRYITHGNRGLGPDEMRAIQADDDVKAGFLVASEQIATELIQGVADLVHIRGVANVLPPLATAQSLGAPSIDTDVEDATWSSEIGSADEDTALAIGKRNLEPHLAAKLIKVSDKLVRLTTGGVVSLVMEQLARKFGVTQEKAFLLGTGAQQPLGVFVASDDGVPTNRDVSTFNSTTAIHPDNLKKVKYTLKAQHRNQPSTRWMFHRDGISNISRLKDGDGAYLWQEGHSIRVGEPDRLLGIPIMESEFAPNTFTSALYVGILANWRHYWIVDALDFQVQRLDEKYALTNQIGFIGRMESDGMPVLAEAFVRVKLG